MRQLQVGDVVRNTNPNWFGHLRQVVEVQDTHYVFRVLDGEHKGMLSRPRINTTNRQFDIGQWTMSYPDHLTLPNGA